MPLPWDTVSVTASQSTPPPRRPLMIYGQPHPLGPLPLIRSGRERIEEAYRQMTPTERLDVLHPQRSPRSSSSPKGE